MNTTNTGAVINTGSVQAPEILETPYNIRADYVGIFVVAFIIGYALALWASKSSQPIYIHGK